METARWQRIDRHNRYCQLCNSDEIVVEFHDFLSSRAPVNQRKAFLKPYYLSRVNILKLGTLFQSKNVHILKNLCKFINHPSLNLSSIFLNLYHLVICIIAYAINCYICSL